jgi:hypothetical protein
MVQRSALKSAHLLDTSGPGMKKPATRSISPPGLIELDEVVLTGDEVIAMVRMLDIRATQVVVRVKREADSPTHEAITLRELAPLLLRQKVFGAQIQYSFESGRWLDTLVVTSAGFRLVRVPIG